MGLFFLMPMGCCLLTNSPEKMQMGAVCILFCAREVFVAVMDVGCLCADECVRVV